VLIDDQVHENGGSPGMALEHIDHHDQDAVKASPIMEHRAQRSRSLFSSSQPILFFTRVYQECSGLLSKYQENAFSSSAIEATNRWESFRRANRWVVQ
jgi:hypothetical protein